MTELRKIEPNGPEQEWMDNHCGYYVWLPSSICNDIATLTGWPVYCVGREANGPIDNRTHGKRIFVQTGERQGTYLLTFEVVDPIMCDFIITLLDRSVTQALRDESERNYHAACRSLGIEE
jgi:hypothetical protein